MPQLTSNGRPGQGNAGAASVTNRGRQCLRSGSLGRRESARGRMAPTTVRLLAAVIWSTM